MVEEGQQPLLSKNVRLTAESNPDWANDPPAKPAETTLGAAERSIPEEDDDGEEHQEGDHLSQ
jgi:hypothetical protein